MTYFLRALSRQLLSPKTSILGLCRGAKIRAHRLEIGPNRFLAYRQVPGQKQPTIVFVPGLHSYLHMQGMTAKALLRYVYVEFSFMYTRLQKFYHTTFYFDSSSVLRHFIKKCHCHNPPITTTL